MYSVIHPNGAPLFCDRNARPLSLPEWANLRSDAAYALVADTRVAANVRVVTVWEGMACVYDPSGVPLVFETIIVAGDACPCDREKHGQRYLTEDDAFLGHFEVVERIRAELDGPRP